MNLAPSPSVKQVSESNHLFELKRTEGKHYWLCVCAGHIEATWVNIIIFLLLLGTALGTQLFILLW